MIKKPKLTCCVSSTKTTVLYRIRTKKFIYLFYSLKLTFLTISPFIVSGHPPPVGSSTPPPSLLISSPSPTAVSSNGYPKEIQENRNFFDRTH